LFQHFTSSFCPVPLAKKRKKNEEKIQ